GLVQASIYDARDHAFEDNRIALSRALAEELSLNIGDKFELERVMDMSGKIRYECATDKTNQFGHVWGKISGPVEARIAAINEEGANKKLYRIGMSAQQLVNMSLRTEAGKD